MSVQQQEPNIQQRIYDLEQQRQRRAAGRAGADAVEKAAKGTHPGFDRIRDCTILSANVQILPGEQKPGMTKETLLENLRLWGESIYLQISALAATYGLFASAYVVFSIIVGERFAPIAVLNNFAHLITLGGLVTLIVVAATPYRRFWAAYSLPAALAFVVWFGPLFLPNISRKPPSGSSELTVATYNTTYRADDYDEMLRVVLALDADVVGIEEASEEFVDATRQEYPYRWQDANFALISRYPIDRAGIHFLVNEEKNRLDTLVAPIDFDGQPVSVYVFHPIRPSLRIRPLLYDSVDREEATQELADAVEHDPNPVVLLCDCNFAYRTDDYRSIAALLTDGWRERGFGFGFTAPVRSPNLPLGRTDCIWHSSDFVTTSIRVGRENGPSDHFPLRATLALMPSAD